MPEKMLQRENAADIGADMVRWLSCLLMMLSVLACDIAGSPLLAKQVVDVASVTQVSSVTGSQNNDETGKSHGGVVGHMAHGHCTANLADPADVSPQPCLKGGQPLLAERHASLTSWSTAPPTQPPSA